MQFALNDINKHSMIWIYNLRYWPIFVMQLEFRASIPSYNIQIFAQIHWWYATKQLHFNVSYASYDLVFIASMQFEW